MQYYYLIAGLRDVKPTDNKISMTPSQVSEELLSAVSESDRRLLELYLLKHDNANLLSLLKGQEEERWEEGGLYTISQLRDAVDLIKQEGLDAQTNLPTYMVNYISEYLDKTDEPVESKIYSESRLSESYYRYLHTCPNKVIRGWFAFNENVKNLLTAANCRRLELDVTPYIIGDSEVAENLRTSKAKDWGLGSEIDYLNDVLRIAAESDVLSKERQLDDFRWKYLDEMILGHEFGIEHLFAFLVKLDIIARWCNLNAELGEQKLRSMIGELKKHAISNQII